MPRRLRAALFLLVLAGAGFSPLRSLAQIGRPDLTQGGGTIQAGWGLTPRLNPAAVVAHQAMMMQGFIYSTSTNSLYTDFGLASASGRWGLVLSGYGTSSLASGVVGSGLSTAGGFYFKPLRLALGVGATLAFSPVFGAGNANLGLLFNPHGNLRIGFVLPALAGGQLVPTFGVSLWFAKVLSAVVEGSFNVNQQAFVLAPSLMIGMREFGLSVCYGVTLSGASASSPMIAEGFSAGLHFRIERLRLTVAYRQPREAELFGQIGVVLGGRD